jgi:hypothetical protein
MPVTGVHVQLRDVQILPVDPTLTDKRLLLSLRNKRA